MKLYVKIGLASAIVCVLGIFVGFLGFPMLLRKMIRSEKNLKPGSETRKIWEKLPMPLKFSIYVFNVTNPQETQNGDRPVLAEVGPFVFEEWKDKYNIEDIEAEDAINFNLRNTYIFRPDLGLSGEELITMPHPLIQVMSIAVKRDKATMISIIAEGIKVIFKPLSPFVRATFMDIFFRGIDVDCSTESFAASAICLTFHTGAVKGAVKINETHFKFSLMGASNHSDAGLFKVARGIKNSDDVGKVLQYNGEKMLKTWPGDECNRFRGTDGTIFAPLMLNSEGLWSFSADICRSMGAKFQQKNNYAGLPAAHFIMDFGDVKNEPENHCFCKDYPTNCPPKGTMDLSLCNATPMIASLPHFLKADPLLLQNVDGLSPDAEKHGIFIDFEAISGTPLSFAKRLQFSLDVEPIPEVEVMQNLRPLIMPLFWLEESIHLNETFTDVLKHKIFFVLNINNAFRWIATFTGACGCLVAVYLSRARNKNNNLVAVTEVQSNTKF